MIRLHDLRHTHASLLLADSEPVKTVSERLGHASATVTMTVYAHHAGRPETGRQPVRGAGKSGLKYQGSITGR